MCGKALWVDATPSCIGALPLHQHPFPNSATSIIKARLPRYHHQHLRHRRRSHLDGTLWRYPNADALHQYHHGLRSRSFIGDPRCEAGWCARRRMEVRHIHCALRREIAHPSRHLKTNTSHRVAVFAALMASSLLPLVHKGILSGLQSLTETPLIHQSVTILCYLTAAGVYISHMPEKKWPETFDIWVSLQLESCRSC